MNVVSAQAETISPSESMAKRAKRIILWSKSPVTTLTSRLSAGEAIRKQAHRGGKIGRAIPPHDDLVVRIDEIGGPRQPIGGHQRGRQIGFRQVAAVGIANSQALPLAERPLALEVDEPGIELGRQTHRATPGLVVPPVKTRQVVRNGGEDIGLARPDVTPPVAIEIDGVAAEAGGHELTLTHGPRPGAGHEID